MAALVVRGYALPLAKVGFRRPEVPQRVRGKDANPQLPRARQHPIEILANGVLSSAIVYLLVGVEPLAAAIAVTMTGIAEFFYHWNVSTPHWLGYLIQRPESHCVHHQRGLHHYNYADVPLWDILFGTFRNPRRWQEQCGFGDEVECDRFGDLLLGRDVAA